jgi:hypothetical protein
MFKFNGSSTKTKKMKIQTSVPTPETSVVKKTVKKITNAISSAFQKAMNPFARRV